MGRYYFGASDRNAISVDKVSWSGTLSSLAGSENYGRVFPIPGTTIVLVFSSTGPSISRSTDNGNSWSYSNVSQANSIVRAFSKIFYTQQGSYAKLKYSSDNGASWSDTTTTLTAGIYNNIAFGVISSTPTLMIARAGSTGGYKSTDGLTWTAITFPRVVQNVFWDGTRFVAVDWQYYTTSTDGTTWSTPATLPDFPTLNWVYTSPGLNNGTAGYSYASGLLTTDLASNNKYVVWSPSTQAWSSSYSFLSGTFRPSTISFDSQDSRHMIGAYDAQTTMLQVNYQGSASNISMPSNSTWYNTVYFETTPIISNIDITVTPEVSSTRSVQYVRPINVEITPEVASRQFIKTKNINITSNVTPTLGTSRFWGNPWSMIYAESKWVGVKNGSNTGATSIDGATWTARTLPSSAHWNSIAHDGTTFVTIAENSNKAAYSADGTTWTASTLPNVRHWHSITAGGTIIVAVAIDSDKCAVSTNNGVSWTEYSMPASANWTGVAWNGTRFVAITDSSVAAYSTDGTSWTQVAMPDNLHYNAVAYGLGQFMAVASGLTPNSTTANAAISTDGITWSRITMPEAAEWTTVGLGIGDPNV